MDRADGFTIYPAIDLRNGQVVRLQQGDPDRQKIYASDPAAVARRWLEAGAPCLHVVNLDGAFGEGDHANRRALAAILESAAGYGAQVQLGGGLRSLEAVREVLSLGAARAVLGTVAVEQPMLLARCLDAFGPQRVAAGLDARSGVVQVRGWKEAGSIQAVDLAGRLARLGLRWVIFTDVSQDGLGQGLNLSATLEVAQVGGLRVIASGGTNSWEDIRLAWDAGLAGVIVGRALYEREVEIQAWRLPGREAG